VWSVVCGLHVRDVRATVSGGESDVPVPIRAFLARAATRTRLSLANVPS
jgi:hypothetical protein